MCVGQQLSWQLGLSHLKGFSTDAISTTKVSQLADLDPILGQLSDYESAD